MITKNDLVRIESEEKTKKINKIKDTYYEELIRLEKCLIKNIDVGQFKWIESADFPTEDKKILIKYLQSLGYGIQISISDMDKATIIIYWLS